MIKAKRRRKKERMFQGIKAVLLDLDETLLDDRAGQLTAARRVCDALAGTAGSDALRFFETYLQVSDDIWVRLGSIPNMTHRGLSGGQAIRLHVWEDTVSKLGCHDEKLALEAAQMYALERKRTYALFPEVATVLERLKTQFRVGIVTNGATGTQREKIEAAGLGPYIDTVVVSGELGYGKPDPRMFLDALNSLGTTPIEALHVGDSLEADVTGAKAAGLYAVWLNRTGVKALQTTLGNHDAEITLLTELLPLISGG